MAICPTGRIGWGSLASVRLLSGVLEASEMAHLRRSGMYRADDRNADTRIGVAIDILEVEMSFSEIAF